MTKINMQIRRDKQQLRQDTSSQAKQFYLGQQGQDLKRSAMRVNRGTRTYLLKSAMTASIWVSDEDTPFSLRDVQGGMDGMDGGEEDREGGKEGGKEGRKEGDRRRREVSEE